MLGLDLAQGLGVRGCRRPPRIANDSISARLRGSARQHDERENREVVAGEAPQHKQMPGGVEISHPVIEHEKDHAHLLARL